MGTMNVNRNCVKAFLLAGSVVAAIAMAPTAAADSGIPQLACNSGAPDTSCESPGNAQLNDSLPPDFTQQYPDFSLFGFGGHGGFHGGGHGGGHR
jgi:hypothetical protein